MKNRFIISQPGNHPTLLTKSYINMEKLSLVQLFNLFQEYNEEHHVIEQFSKNALQGVIVFKESNWKQKYPLESRSYKVSSANKAFLSGFGGNSIYATNLDKTDVSIRLDNFFQYWEIDYCYIIK